MAMAAVGRGPWPQARPMATAAAGRDHGHVHIHGGHEHGHITRLQRRYGHVRSDNGYVRGLSRGGGGRRTRVKGRRKEAEEKKETYIPRTSVGGASRGARADATRGGGSCGARADAGEAGAKVDTIVNCRFMLW